MTKEKAIAEDRRWQQESDARTLVEAHTILQSSERSAGAKKAALKLAKDSQETVNSFLAISSGKSKLPEKKVTKERKREPKKEPTVVPYNIFQKL